MAIVIVLGLLSITLALSYSMLRTQVRCVQIQSNSLRRANAQLAAMAGIQAALHAMSQPDWEGVGVPIAGRLSGTESYSVTVETGDPSLGPSHPDYDEYPYRVTLTSTGMSRDPSDPTQQSIHRIRVVVRLVRRKLADPADGWSRVLPYTLYQWSRRDVDIELPARIQGSSYLQGRLRSRHHYPDPEASSRYLRDLELMRGVGLSDQRPFEGPLYLPFSGQSSQSLLVDDLKLWVNDIAAYRSRRKSDDDDRDDDDRDHWGGYRDRNNDEHRWGTGYRDRDNDRQRHDDGRGHRDEEDEDRDDEDADDGLLLNDIPAHGSLPFSHPGNIPVYRLYPGGEEYQTQPLSARLRNAMLKKDILTNPLGVYIRRGDLEVGRNVTVRGFLVTWNGYMSADIRMNGENIEFQAEQLPPLAGDTNVYQLPAMAASDDITFFPQTDVRIKGAVYAGDGFRVIGNPKDVKIRLQGKLICGELGIQRKQPWNRQEWYDALKEFKKQKTTRYFPQWIEKLEGLASEPLITVQMDSGGVVHHWPDWSQPIFVPHPDDGGLRWEVVEWIDGYSSGVAGGTFKG